MKTCFLLLLQDIEAPLRLQQLIVAFRLLGLGIGMGIIAFITEKVIEKINHKNNATTESLMVLHKEASTAWR